MAEKPKKKIAQKKETEKEVITPVKEDDKKEQQAKQEPKTESAAPRRLFRSETNKIIAGVAGGLGEYFNIDPLIIRVLFVLFTLIHGSGILLYLILWVLLPQESSTDDASKDSGEIIHKNIAQVKEEMKSLAGRMRTNRRENSGSLVGIILIIFGLLILIDNLGFPVWLGFEKLWPIILIIVGFAILSK